MKVGFIIIGRLKSTRLKEKLLLDLVGKPVIARMVDRIRESESVEEVIIATSSNTQDDPLEEFSKEYGVTCFRGDEDDVLDRIYSAAVASDLDYIVNVTADCPLVEPEYIDKTVAAFEATDADLITSLDLPHGAFCYGIKPLALKKVLEIKDSENSEVWGKYFYDTDCFNVYELPIAEKHRRIIRLTIDYPEDYELLKRIYGELQQPDSEFSLDEIINLIDQQPNLLEINRHCGALYANRARIQSKIKLKPRYEVKRAVVIGAGSIGKRHIKNLQTLGINEIAALRTKRGTTQNLPPELDVRELNRWDELYRFAPDIAIISNPTSLHLETFLRSVSRVKGIFIEKPISYDMEGVEEAAEAILQHKPTTFIGYNLRFHPVMKKVTELIDSEKLGAPISAQINVGQWLPDWHPSEDHQQLYAARKDLGGGALLSLIHEVQIALDCCGDYSQVTALFPPSSLLNLEVDVRADLMVQHTAGTVSQIHIDLIQQPAARSGVILCERGNIKYDLMNNRVLMSDLEHPTGKVVLELENFDSNEPYLEMMEEFIACTKRGLVRHSFDFFHGMQSLQLADEALAQFKSSGGVI